MNAMEKLLQLDVQDPTDFPASALSLRQLDAALRCGICGELFDGPITVNCGHCFCSFCLRNAIANKPECPACRKQVRESHIRPNLSIAEAVTSWKASRASILRLSKEEERRDARPKLTSSNHGSSRKRKRSGSSDVASSDPGISVAGSSNPVSDFPCSPGRSSSSKPMSPVEEPVESNSDDDVVQVLSQPPQGAHSTAGATQQVECPICGRSVKYDSINDHMDRNCPSPTPHDSNSSLKAEQKKQWSQLMGGGGSRGKGKENTRLEELEPLPKVSYHTLKDKKLKALLSDEQLSSTGDRSTLIARHQRWVMLWNANLDRSVDHRRTPQELRVELTKWEEGRKGKKPPLIDNLSEYERANRVQFDQLIAAARPKRPDKAIKREEGERIATDGGEPNPGGEHPLRSEEPIVIDPES